jgi:hypothetical protein
VRKQQPNPLPVQGEVPAVAPRGKGGAHGVARLLVALASQALADPPEVLLQFLAVQGGATRTVQGGKAPAQVQHVVLDDHLNPFRQALLHHHHGAARHPLAQGLGQVQAADHAALVLHENPGLLPRQQLEQGDTEGVLEINLAGLGFRQLAEGGAPVPGQTLQVHAARQGADDPGLASAGFTADQDDIRPRQRALKFLQQEPAHRLVAAQHQRVIDTLVAQPLAHRLRTQAAAETVQVPLRVAAGEFAPAGQAPGPHLSRHQLVTQLDGRGLALLFVTGADPGALLVGHQWQAVGAGKGPVSELRRGAHIHHRRVGEKQLPVVSGIGARGHGGSLLRLAAEQGEDALLQAADGVRHQGKVRIEASGGVAFGKVLVFFHQLIRKPEATQTQVLGQHQLQALVPAQ